MPLLGFILKFSFLFFLFVCVCVHVRSVTETRQTLLRSIHRCVLLFLQLLGFRDLLFVLCLRQCCGQSHGHFSALKK